MPISLPPKNKTEYKNQNIKPKNKTIKSQSRSKSKSKSQSQSIYSISQSQSMTHSMQDAISNSLFVVNNLKSIPDPNKRGISFHISNVRRNKKPFAKLIKLYMNGVLKDKIMVSNKEWDKVLTKNKKYVMEHKDEIQEKLDKIEDQKILNNIPEIAYEAENTVDEHAMENYGKIAGGIAVVGILGFMVDQFICSGNDWIIPEVGGTIINLLTTIITFGHITQPCDKGL